MTRTPRGRWLRLLSVIFAAAPLAFATIRAVTTRHDLRMLWMAIAALVGVAIVMLAGRARSRTRNAVLMLSLIAFVVATLLTGATAYGLGATAAAGIWPVSVVLAFCWTCSFALNALARLPID